MRGKSGPSLPQALLEELHSAEDSSSGYKGGTNKTSRKEFRKQQRIGKKQSKAQFFGSAHDNPKRRADQDHADAPQRKKQKLSSEYVEAQQTRRHVKTVSHTNSPSFLSTMARSDSKPKLKESIKPTAFEKFAARDRGSRLAGVSTTTQGTRTQEERAEDAYIARLEAKLGMRKQGKVSKEWEEDGLDDLLRDLDTLEDSLFTTNSPEHSVDETFSEEDEDGFGTAEHDDDDDVSSEREASSNESDIYPEWGGFGDGDGSDSGSESEASSEPPQLLRPASSRVELLAGSRYIPPHLRNRQSDVQESEAQVKLKRQLKGLLNRLSEQNIATILDGIEELYRGNRRHDVTATITNAVVDGISAHSILLDSYVVLHAALVSSLHKIIGVEFAAYFVQHVVSTYEKHFSALQENPDSALPGVEGASAEDVKGKETSNLIVLLSELYNFQVISCLLVYDIIRMLLEGDLTEFKVELLLKITRNSGQQLRTDDPSALKDIIQLVHSKLPNDQNALSSRSRFMVETLTNLKNNRIKKPAAGQHAGGDALERLKKFLSGLSKKRQVRAHEPLRITLKDLHSAESKGKWWLVGAAWGGDPLVEHQENAAAPQPVSGSPSENTLMQLARKQGMNTEIRRKVFVVLMSSADYVEACDRLAQLRLTEVQQREFIRVILHCCGNEKRFNPYYILVGQQLCRISKSHQFTLQYCLWDFLRDLGETTVGGAEILKNMKDDEGNFELKRISETRCSNIARAYGWWIAKDCCSLTMLKPIDFTILKPRSRTFLTQLLTHTLMSTQVSTPLLSTSIKDLPDTHHRGPLEEVFIKATRIPAMAMGMLYFIGEMGHEESEEAQAGILQWARRVALETLRTGMDVVPNL